MSWWFRNAESIEAGAALVTAVVAVVALVGIKYQLDEADRLQQAQSARDAYRAHLALAANLPQFARPQDACSLVASSDGGAYEAFVDHLLYSAEQMLAVHDGWERTFLSALDLHTVYLCSSNAPLGETDDTVQLLNRFRATACSAKPDCS
jgi:hypothetical protein